MSQEIEHRPLMVRFIESFFEERNIKWLLSIGMLILFGSSVMLVTSRWDSYAPTWKHLILLGYTACIYGCADFCDRRWSLHRTGTVLKCLTVLLLPINFLALHRIWMVSESGPLETVMHWILLVATSVFSWWSSGRIFRHFLRGPQGTFEIAYLTLSVAGAVVPGLPANWSPVIALALWAVMTLGVVKVSRHLFWLAEESALPRVFGFFPTLLLGTQFFVLVWAAKLALGIAFPWMGLGLVLISLPILLTADAVAHVFQQRTGTVIRPIPWAILLPLFASLLLCVSGVGLAGSGWPQPYALVPTAALTALLMGVIAHRLQSTAFVWVTLSCVLLAYNFSPLCFQDAARTAIHNGAAAVQEQRLPYAFYGLTYLPLLLVTTALGSRRTATSNRLWAGPLQQFSVMLAVLLLGASWTHSKAMFPVAVALLPLFSLQLRGFRCSQLILLVMAAVISAALGFPAFATAVLQWNRAIDLTELCLAGAAAGLLFPGFLIDRWLARADQRWRDHDAPVPIPPIPVCQVTSLVVTVVTALEWCVHFAPSPQESTPWMSGALLSLLLFAQALVWLLPFTGEVALIFAGWLGFLLMEEAGCTASVELTAVHVTLLLAWSLARLLCGWPNRRIAMALGAPLGRVSLFGLVAILICRLASGPQFNVADPATGVLTALTIVWTFTAARQYTSWLLATLGCVAALTFVGEFTNHYQGQQFTLEWLPLIWTAMAIAALPIATRLRSKLLEDSSSASLNRDAGCRAIATPLNLIVLAILMTAASATLISLTVPYRVAGIVAALGLLAAGRMRRSPTLPQAGLILLTYQSVASVSQLFADGAATLFTWSESARVQGSLAIAAWSGLCLIMHEILVQRERHPALNEDRMLNLSRVVAECLRELNLFFLRILILAALTISLKMSVVRWTSFQIAAVLLSFSAVILCELLAACRQQRTERVWFAQIAAAALTAYLVWMGVITSSSSIATFVPLAVAGLFWMAGHLSQQTSFTSIMQQPLMRSALVLPLITVGIAIYRFVEFAPAVWLGVPSLALFLVAAFYFWVGIERRQKQWVVLSATVFNVALALLWRELHWHDPQFFMVPIGISIIGLVQLLKREIPEALRTPLTYLGALTILVSPTFHIVSGSWLHLLSLLVLAVFVVLVSIGLKVRALMYTGTAFLVAGLIAMICRGGIDFPHLLWAGGIVLGGGVIALAAVCERHRESLLQRLRYLAAGLENWQ